MIQVDIEVWGQTVKKKGGARSMDLQVAIISVMNVLQELEQQMAQERGPLY